MKMRNRMVALLLCAALLAATVPAVSAVEAVDFQEILNSGSQSESTVRIVTEPALYVESIQDFVGEYVIFRERETEIAGIMDCHGNVVYRWREGIPEPGQIVGSNLFLSDGTFYGKLHDFQGNLLLDMYIQNNDCEPLFDLGTGENVGCGIWRSHGDNEALYGILVSNDGGIMGEYVYSAPKYGLVRQRTDAAWGLGRFCGEEILPCVYDTVEILSADRIFVRKDGEAQLLSADGSLVKELPWEDVISVEMGKKQFFRGKQNGKYGVVDLDGTTVIPFEFDTLTPSHDEDFPLIGSIGDTQYWISGDPSVQFCGSRCFPEGTRILAQDRYQIPDGDGYALVNGQGERLIPETIEDSYGCRLGDTLILSVLETGTTRFYDRNLEMLLELSDGFCYGFTKECVLWGQTDEDGTENVIFYDRNGQQVNRVSGNYYMNDSYGAVFYEGNKIAFADKRGNLYPDRYVTALKVSGGWDGDQSPFYVVEQETGEPMQMIDIRTGKNALYDGATVSGNELLPEGSYFPYWDGDRIGVAKITRPGESPFRDVSESAWYTEPAKFCYNAGLMNGTGDGCFSPKMEMTRAMLVQVLYSISGEKTESFGFTDVPDGKWYSDAVNWAAANEIVAGLGDGKFGPNEPVTRQQIVTMLFKYASLYRSCEGDPAILEAYDDAGSVSSYALTPLAWAVENGMVSGITPTTLEPKMTATRAQIATLLMRFIEYMAAPTEP